MCILTSDSANPYVTEIHTLFEDYLDKHKYRETEAFDLTKVTCRVSLYNSGFHFFFYFVFLNHKKYSDLYKFMNVFA